MNKICTRILSALLMISTSVSSMTMWTPSACAGETENLSQSRPVLPSVARHAAELGTEALKFYTAVATVSFWECYRTQDPVKCQNFLESMEDPGTHIGFGLFVVGQKGTNAGILKLTRGKFSGGMLGMVAGMLASDLYSELYTSPQIKEFLNLDKKKYSSHEARFKRRQELTSQLFAETLGQKKWWLDKLPNVVSLVGAGALSSLVLPTTAKGLNGTENAIRYFAKDARSAQALAKIREGITTYRLAVKAGMGLLDVLETKNPWTFVALQVGEMVVFLNIADWIEHPVRKWWDEYRSVHDLNSAITKLQLKVNIAQTSGTKLDPSQFESLIHDVEMDWDAYRTSQFIEARTVQGEYSTVMSSMSNSVRDYYLEYQWVMAGAPSDPEKVPQWKGSIPSSWEDKDRGDAAEIRRNFFCGEDPISAAKEATHFHGIMVPGKGDRVEPFRVVKGEKLCSSPLSLSSDQDRILFDHQRAQALKSGQYDDDLDAAFLQALQGFNRVQSKIVSRYERHIRSALGDGLLGTEKGKRLDPVIVDYHDYYDRGVLPSYVQELQYWKDLGRKYPELGSRVDAALDRAQRKSDAAHALLTYLLDPTPAGKKAILASDTLKDGSDVDLFEDEKTTTTEDWQKVVQIWKEFLLGPVGHSSGAN